MGPRPPHGESLKRAGTPKGPSRSPHAQQPKDHTRNTHTHTQPCTTGHVLSHSRAAFTHTRLAFTHANPNVDFTHSPYSHRHTLTHEYARAPMQSLHLEACRKVPARLPPRIFQPTSQSPWNLCLLLLPHHSPADERRQPAHPGASSAPGLLSPAPSTTPWATISRSSAPWDPSPVRLMFAYFPLQGPDQKTQSRAERAPA